MAAHRPYTIREEAAHAVSHGVGAALALAGLPVLVGAAAWRRDPWQVVGAAVFGLTLLTLYSASTIYHAVRTPKAKDVWRRLDHAAIYLLIAGTYTPFLLGALRGPWGWTLLAVQWGLAVVGVVAKTVGGASGRWTSTAVYLVMGWLVLVALEPLTAAVGTHGLAWLVAGGASYTVGVVFYAWRRLPYGHFVWHLFVMAGSACHFVAVLVAPAAAQASPAQRRLQEIGRTSVGNAVLLEPRTVVRTDTIVTAAVRVRFEKPVRSAGGEIRSSRTIAMFDCRTGYVAVKENWYYGDADGTKVVDHKVVGKPGFSSPIKGTLPDIAGRHLCAKAP